MSEVKDFTWYIDQEVQICLPEKTIRTRLKFSFPELVNDRDGFLGWRSAGRMNMFWNEDGFIGGMSSLECVLDSVSATKRYFDELIEDVCGYKLKGIKDPKVTIYFIIVQDGKEIFYPENGINIVDFFGK